MVSAKVEVIGKEIVNAKLLAARPRILIQNRAMVEGMLQSVREVWMEDTPLGPGRDGHLRNQATIAVWSEGTETSGVLKSPRKGYWREYGTRGRYRQAGTRRGYAAKFGALGTGGERAYMTAHHALSGIRRFLQFYYGKSLWWKS